MLFDRALDLWVGKIKMGKHKDTRAARLELKENKIAGFSFPCFGEDEYVKELGAGGSGIVFRADQIITKDVRVPRAIKFFMYRDDIAELTIHKRHGPISREDFEAEIVNITSFNHQYLVKVISAGFYDSGDGQVPYIVTDFVSGPTLRGVISSDANQACKEAREIVEDNPEVILDILVKIGEAVAHIFDRGFSHCDIAPKNIFLQVVGGRIQPILGDLGISKRLDVKEVSRKAVFIAGSKDWIPGRVSKVLETEISYQEFVSLQPYWDIYGFCKTGLELIKSFPGVSRLYWFQAVEKALSKGLEEGGYSSIHAVIERLEFLKPVYREVARIPELSNGIGRGVRKMMPVEALKASDRLDVLVRHPAIFRLSRVPQLTTSNYILPGSTHTRYEHTLGVLETMRRYLISLLDEKEFLEHFSVARVEIALIAAAFSSMTRFPLSNVIHEMRGRDKSCYSVLSRANIWSYLGIILNKEGKSIFDVVSDKFKNVPMEDLKLIIQRKQSDMSEEDSLIYSMLNSSLDVRTVDFVRRDAHHLGIVNSEAFQLDEILPHLTVHNNKLALRATGISVAEHVVSLRYWLFSRAYWNRPNRAYFAMCRYVFSRLWEEGFGARVFPEVLGLDQMGVLGLVLRISQDAGLNECVDIIKKIMGNEGELYKLVFEESRESIGAEDGAIIDWASQASFIEVDRVMRCLEGRFREFCEGSYPDGERILLFDFPTEPGSIKLGDDIYVTDSRVPARLLTQVSPIVRGVNDSFVSQLSRLRIYRHPAVRIMASRKPQLDEFFITHLRIAASEWAGMCNKTEPSEVGGV